MFTRREMIHALGAGLGSVGLAALLAPEASAAAHLKPRAKRIIQLFMNGGPSRAISSTRNPPSTSTPASGPGRSSCARRIRPAG